jgi:hypothetical protein
MKVATSSANSETEEQTLPIEQIKSVYPLELVELDELASVKL